MWLHTFQTMSCRKSRKNVYISIYINIKENHWNHNFHVSSKCLKLTWSRMTISVSSWRWQATLSLLFSDTVRSSTLVCFTWLNPRSSIKASILPLVSLPLVKVPGSLISEWNKMVCLTLMSVVKLMFLSTRDTLSSILLGETLKMIE